MHFISVERQKILSPDKNKHISFFPLRGDTMIVARSKHLNHSSRHNMSTGAVQEWIESDVVNYFYFYTNLDREDQDIFDLQG